MMNTYADIPDGEPKGPFGPVDLDAIAYIAHNLREASRLEIFGRLDHDSPDLLAMELVAAVVWHGRGRTVWHKGRPAAWIATIETEPGSGVWYTSMAGTDDLPHVGIHCLRWARWSAVKTRHNGKLLECWSRVSDDPGPGKFIEGCGGVKDGAPEALGKDGGLYQRYIWRFGDNDLGVSQAGRVNADILAR